MTNISVTILKTAAKNQGGLEKYTSRIVDAFLERGRSVTLVTNNLSTQGKPGLQVIANSPSLPFSFLKVRHFDAFCQKVASQKSIVLGMDRTRFQTHLRAGNGVHAAYLNQRKKQDFFLKQFSYSINPLHRIILQIEKEAFENPLLKKIFTNSFMVKSQILEYYRVDHEKIQVIHNGVEWKELETPFQIWQEMRSELLKKYSLSPHDYQFLFIGHNFQRKGLDLLLKALSIMPRKEFHLSVIGKDKNLPRYLELVEKLGLSTKVSFFGPISPVTYFYQLADALVIPSHYDPFANVTVEALAMGVFVISSKNNGGSEILFPENGIIIDDLYSKESIVQSLLEAMEHPKTAKSAEVIRRSVSHLDFSIQIKNLIEGCLA